MGATSPGEVIQVFVKYFNSSDLEGLLTLYEDQAVIANGRDALTGTAAVTEFLQGFLDTKGTLAIESSVVFSGQELALTHNRWRLDIPGTDPMMGTTAEVVRRQTDGTWKYILDNPFGGAALDA